MYYICVLSTVCCKRFFKFEADYAISDEIVRELMSFLMSDEVLLAQLAFSQKYFFKKEEKL